MSYQEELRREREYTARVQQVLLAVISQSSEYTASHEQTIRMLLADAWDELRLKPTALSPQDLEMLSIELGRFEARKAFNRDFAARCRRMLLSPFFGRVDFREDGEDETERIVVGLYSLRDEKGDLLVHDWRAPVCSLYYEAGPGRASYRSPSGVIAGDLLLKRQYRMKDGRLEYFVDTSVSIDDHMLLDILSQSTSRHMRQIVSSIQSEQNAAIRVEKEPVLSVVGAAGSGKTSVALHRASYLLYSSRDTLDAAHVAVISPTTAFIDYISEVLPDLGEENIRAMTMYSVLRGALRCSVELPQDQNETALAADINPLRADSIAKKGGAEICRALEDFAERWKSEGPEFADLVLEGRALVSQGDLQEMYRREFGMLSPALRLVRIQAVLESRAREAERALKERFEQVYAGRYRGKELRTAVRLAVSQRMKPVRDQIHELCSVEPLDLYAQALEPFDADLALAARQIISRRFLWWEDAPGAAWLLCALGFIQPDTSVRLLIIDEAQDYPEIALRALHLLFPRAQATILGDPDQRTCPHLPPCDPKAWGAAFGRPEAPTQTLSHCYRSSLPIARLLNALLPDGTRLQPFGREGAKPQVGPYSPEALLQRLAAWEEAGLRSVAVVTRSMAEAKALRALLPKAALLTGEEDMMPEEGGVVLASYHLLKGLEFDAVAVIWPDVRVDDGERRRLYAACSRALHDVSLLAGEATLRQLAIVT